MSAKLNEIFENSQSAYLRQTGKGLQKDHPVALHRVEIPYHGGVADFYVAQPLPNQEGPGVEVKEISDAVENALKPNGLEPMTPQIAVNMVSQSLIAHDKYKIVFTGRDMIIRPPYESIDEKMGALGYEETILVEN